MIFYCDYEEDWLMFGIVLVVVLIFFLMFIFLILSL